MPKAKVVGKYLVGKTIGEGTFGKVKLSVNTETGERVAIKVLEKARIQAQDMHYQIKKEISIMKIVKHSNVVQMHEVLSSKTRIFIVLELVSGGELFDKIVRQRRFSEVAARAYFRQLMRGVKYCHGVGVYHRDLKPENLLLDASDTLKISDFGLSALYTGSETGEGRATLLHTTCGTPNYVAPEVLADKGYDGGPADLWSCGVILFVLLAGYLPFDEPTVSALFRKIQMAEYTIPQWFSPPVREFLKRLLVADPTHRLTLAQLEVEPWFVGDDNFKCEEEEGGRGAPASTPQKDNSGGTLHSNNNSTPIATSDTIVSPRDVENAVAEVVDEDGLLGGLEKWSGGEGESGEGGKPPERLGKMRLPSRLHNPNRNNQQQEEQREGGVSGGSVVVAAGEEGGGAADDSPPFPPPSVPCGVSGSSTSSSENQERRHTHGGVGGGGGETEGGCPPESPAAQEGEGVPGGGVAAYRQPSSTTSSKRGDRKPNNTAMTTSTTTTVASSTSPPAGPPAATTVTTGNSHPLPSPPPPPQKQQHKRAAEALSILGEPGGPRSLYLEQITPFFPNAPRGGLGELPLGKCLWSSSGQHMLLRGSGGGVGDENSTSTTHHCLGLVAKLCSALSTLGASASVQMEDGLSVKAKMMPAALQVVKKDLFVGEEERYRGNGVVEGGLQGLPTTIGSGGDTHQNTREGGVGVDALALGISIFTVLGEVPGLCLVEFRRRRGPVGAYAALCVRLQRELGLPSVGK